jgi:hypothetical protein
MKFKTGHRIQPIPSIPQLLTAAASSDGVAPGPVVTAAPTPRFSGVGPLFVSAIVKASVRLVCEHSLLSASLVDIFPPFTAVAFIESCKSHFEEKVVPLPPLAEPVYKSVGALNVCEEPSRVNCTVPTGTARFVPGLDFMTVLPNAPPDASMVVSLIHLYDSPTAYVAELESKDKLTLPTNMPKNKRSFIFIIVML